VAGGYHVTALCLAASCLVGASAAAESRGRTDPLAELDGLSQASTDFAAGMALARRQADGGDLTGAVATLERVLMLRPEADNALLFHASLLCRLDDRDGARVEIATMRRAVTNQAWADVRAACGDLPRPTGEAG